MTDSKKVSFKDILKRSNSKIQDERAKRISKRAQNEYDSLIKSLENKIMNIEDEIDSMSDISTSNVTTSANAIKGTTFDAKAFVIKRAGLLSELALAKEELEILREDKEFYS